MSREKRIPGPDHPIAVVENSSLIRVVTRDGRKVVTETTSAVTLTEAGCPAVHYIPLADIDQALVERTDSHTYCPYKDEASYYSLVTPEKKIADAAWFYEEPFQAVEAIAGRVAFYPEHVEITSEAVSN